MQFRPRLTNKKEEVDGWLKLIHYVRSLGGINAALQVLLPKLEHHVHNVTDETPAELGLRLTYTPGNLPANNLAAWNAFFDLPTNGTAFTSMSTAGDEVTLIGGAGITLKASLFRTSATLLKIEDDVDCVVAIAGGEKVGALSLCPNLTTVTLNGVITVAREGIFSNAALVNVSLDACTTLGLAAIGNCTSVATFNFPALTTAGNDCFYPCVSATTFTLPLLTSAGNNCFRGCTSVVTFSLPLLTSAGSSCFQDCSATVISLPNCTSLGLTTGDNSVFSGCTNLTTVYVPTALATVDGGNPDGDLVYAVGTLGATINYL